MLPFRVLVPFSKANGFRALGRRIFLTVTSRFLSFLRSLLLFPPGEMTFAINKSRYTQTMNLLSQFGQQGHLGINGLCHWFGLCFSYRLRLIFRFLFATFLELLTFTLIFYLACRWRHSSRRVQVVPPFHQSSQPPHWLPWTKSYQHLEAFFGTFYPEHLFVRNKGLHQFLHFY